MVYPTLWRTGSPVWEDVFSTRRELDRVLNRFLTPAASLATAWSPSMDIQETADEIRVQAELPGMARDDIAVNLENNILTISGEKKGEVAEDAASEWHVLERQYGRFERSFRLPRTVDAQKISATFADGILRVALPKTEAAKPRRIEVTVDGRTPE